MKPLNLTLQDDVDAGVLSVLAKFWKVNITGLDRSAQIAAVREVMLNPARTEVVWDGLSDDQRGALQMLVVAGGQMPMAKFSRLFGEIRQMGIAQIEREKPLEKPRSIAEGLYYRGLVAQTFSLADTGAQLMIYVPEDLLRALPVRKTSYSNLAAGEPLPAEEQSEEPLIEPLTEVTGAKQADTSLVDDMATLLAYLQLFSPNVETGWLGDEERDWLRKHLLKPEDERIHFLFAISISSDLVEIQAGKAFPKRAETRRWLESTRAAQVQALAEGWRGGQYFREMWFLPGLHPDPGGELDEYDAAVARSNALDIMGELVPKQEWWAVADFIDAVKETEPDFQRPGGDYASWYIRNDQNEYISGFESWDAVEGALLEYYLATPMHWLGLVDRADGAVRLTAYGRAFLGQTPWPTPQEAEDKVAVKDDGSILVPRKVSRVDRFQIARFTTWVGAGDPYTYKLDAAGIQRAAQQGINTGHISSFLTRALGDKPLPEAILRLLDNWRSGPSANVSLEQLQVLRTTDTDTLNRIFDTPALRRYLGAKLGPMAVIVRADQWDALLAALGEQGIQVEVVR